MKVTFYGGIALAAIAADKVNAISYDEIESDELAQNTVSTEIESNDVYTQASSEGEADSTNLATVDSEADAQSEGQVDAWSDAESESASAFCFCPC